MVPLFFIKNKLFSLTCNGQEQDKCLSCSEENYRYLEGNNCLCLSGYLEIENYC